MRGLRGATRTRGQLSVQTATELRPGEPSCLWMTDSGKKEKEKAPPSIPKPRQGCVTRRGAGAGAGAAPMGAARRAELLPGPRIPSRVLSAVRLSRLQALPAALPSLCPAGAGRQASTAQLTKQKGTEVREAKCSGPDPPGGKPGGGLGCILVPVPHPRARRHRLPLPAGRGQSQRRLSAGTPEVT